MKAISVLFDSLNRNLLPPYGCDWVHAPNFARLAARAVTFDCCYVGSMPCMPARRELHTGRYNFLHRSWGPLEPFDDSAPELLQEHGVHTHLVSDHYHYWEDGGATYHHRFNTWEAFRGQEGDAWKGELAEPQIPPALGSRAGTPKWRQDWVNRAHTEPASRHPQTRTFDAGLEFIDANHDHDDWFLQIESFDPHEPFFAPPEFHDLYPENYDGPHFDWPDYARVTETPEQVAHLRRRYAALVSMCDASLGRVLDRMDELDLWQDTMLLVHTDHGYLLGEHGWWAKNDPPFYDEVARIPMLSWDPRSAVAGQRRQSLVQTIDVAPTLLEFFGVERPPDMQGVPLRDTIAADRPAHEAALFGIHGGHVNCTDGRYVYMRACVSPDNGPLFDYTLMPVRPVDRMDPADLQDLQLVQPFSFTKGCRVMRLPGKVRVNPHATGHLLFDTVADPAQECPLEDPDLEARMVLLLRRLLRDSDAPVDQYERLGLQP
jgi:arylsulfatase A-like enzyme